MGGMIAIDWINRHPLEINNTVLINTNVQPYLHFFTGYSGKITLTF